MFWLDDMLGGIFFSRSVDGGTVFSTPKDVSTAPGSLHSAIYRLRCRGQSRQPEPGVGDSAMQAILFSALNRWRVHFLARQRRYPIIPNSAFFPQIAVDGSGNINVLWFDEVTGIPDILIRAWRHRRLLRNDVASLPESALKSKSVRAAMLHTLADVEQSTCAGRHSERGQPTGKITQPSGRMWNIGGQQRLDRRTARHRSEIRRSIDIIRANLGGAPSH